MWSLLPTNGGTEGSGEREKDAFGRPIGDILERAPEPITQCPEEKFPDGEDGLLSDGQGTREGREEGIHRLPG